MDYISIITFFLGFLIAELIRRWNRVEAFNKQIFEYRLEIYTELFSLWNKVYGEMTSLVDHILTTEEPPDEMEWDQLHFSIVLPMLTFLDDKALFLSEELRMECGAAYLADGFSERNFKLYLSNIRERHKSVLKMIQAESGMDCLNKNLQKIIKYKHRSPLISYYTSEKKRQKTEKHI